ncbi:ribonuclease R [Carnobacteriaceae bacterium zg-ZUI240]|nr:ribonuclease R [Carnobacteriaceae bacterium zg-ZUI240]
MKEQILSELQQGSLTMHQLAERLAVVSSADYKTLAKTIASLEEENALVFLTNGKVSLPQKKQTYTGLYRANDKGFGFVTVDGLDNDVFIPKGQTGTAMSGDTVTLKITKSANQDKSAEGMITDIQTRAYTTVVGEFVPYTQSLIDKTGYVGYVILSDKKLNHLTCFVTTNGMTSVMGMMVLVDIVTYPNSEQSSQLTGVIVKEIGHKDDPGVDILSILYKFGISTTFKQDTLEQANAVPQEIQEADIKKRRDLRHLDIITIDGVDAKDLDDAISLRVLENGHFELGVHIADVSHYVTKNSPLDAEAYERATSVYLADRVVPMLPQRLSNGICSLHPHVDRLTLTCMMVIDSGGQVVSHDIFESVIQSRQRMTYERVNMAIVEHNKNAREEYAPFLDMLENMRTLHYALYNKRFKRGAIDFDAKESKIIVDEDGKPLDIVLRERGLAERMIESFMLCANETVAKHYIDAKLPFIYRVHEQPAEEKMQRFMEFVTNFGVMMKGQSATVQSKQLQQVLTKVENQPYEAVVSTMLLRSMKQARYDNLPLGHFGLATDTYTHFTSPIRRYPDLIVHRFIKAYATKRPTKEQKDSFVGELEAIAHQSSVMERKAVEAERDVDALKKAEFMLDKVNQTFEGVVSSVTRFGVFVELPNTIEGLVHVSKMKDDHYEFVENHMLLIGQRTGQTYQIGQKVKVTVTKVDVEQRDIDFVFVTDKKEKKDNSRHKSKKQTMKKFAKSRQKRRR